MTTKETPSTNNDSIAAEDRQALAEIREKEAAKRIKNRVMGLIVTCFTMIAWPQVAPLIAAEQPPTLPQPSNEAPTSTPETPAEQKAEPKKERKDPPRLQEKLNERLAAMREKNGNRFTRPK